MFDWGAPVLVTKSFIVRIAPLLTGRHTVLELYISCSYFQRIGKFLCSQRNPFSHHSHLLQLFSNYTLLLLPSTNADSVDHCGI